MNGRFFSAIALAVLCSVICSASEPTVKGEVRLVKKLFRVQTRQASFVADGYMVNLSNDGHAIAYRLPDGSDTLRFDLACAREFKPHCNVANCIRRGAHDFAYVTEWNGERRLFVEDIARDGATGKWRSRMVQTITTDIPDSVAGPGYRDWVCDFRKGRLYAFTYMGSEPDNDRQGPGVILLEFKLPRRGKDVCLSEKDILRRSEVPMVNATQDKEIRDGKMYVAAGLKTKNTAQASLPDRNRRIVVIDLKTLSVEKEYSLQAYNAEPEGLDWYDGHWIMTFNRDWCWQIEL